MQGSWLERWIDALTDDSIVGMMARDQFLLILLIGVGLFIMIQLAGIRSALRKRRVD